MKHINYLPIIKSHSSYIKYKSLIKNIRNKKKSIKGKLLKLQNFKNKSNPLVTIITVVKNNETLIEKTIKSVINQNYENIEYIVIDGKSSDKTLIKIKKYKNHISTFLSEKDEGIYDAMNKGIVISSGSIIGIINSGDVFTKNAIRIIVNNLKNNDFIFGPIKKDRVLFNFKPNLIKYKFNIFPSHSTSFFVKKKIHYELGLYDLKYKLSADYDFIYKLIKKKKKYKILNTQKLIGICYPHKYSSKFSTIDHLNEEIKIRIGNKQNILAVLILYFIKFIYNYIKKIK